ncbi:type VII secretion protein EccE [Mycobacterium lacus]|nr:type VII secretion protein EccE [Mycobacterium lacus]MCV7121576.1 type VII secretion protein EccE [Mycobacterium lacus]ORW07680.1 type VII secretion protein EccE [Mycobacterium lacus]
MPSPVWPTSGRITLALLAVVPAAMAYPWSSTRDYCLLGIAAVVVILLFGWWRGLRLTTILRRRLAMMRRGHRSVPDSGTRTTALLRVGPPAAGADVLALPLLTRYLNCYGIRADKIRISHRRNTSGADQTWIGLTVSADDNLAALQARSPRIPLHETAQVAARRLADHLREMGWEASAAGPDDIPGLLAADGAATRERWSGMAEDGSNYVAAYRVSVDDALPDTLEAIRSHPARETWTALEIAGEPTSYTVAAACAFRSDARPSGIAPLPGLTPQRGNHRRALMALDPLSVQRLDGHTAAPVDLRERSLAFSRT